MASRGTTSAGPEPRRYDIRIADGRDDAASITRLWDHYFGVEYEPGRLPWPCADIAGWVDDEDRGEEENAPLATRGVIAEHEGVRIGAGIAGVYTREDIVRDLPDGRFDADALASDRNGWLNFGAVDPAWRGHGIGRRLFSHRLDWLRAQGVEIILSIGWERRDAPTSRPLFEGHGFEPIQEFPGYYAEHRWQCPDCGIWKSEDGDCRCSMTLWAKDITEDS